MKKLIALMAVLILAACNGSTSGPVVEPLNEDEPAPTTAPTDAPTDEPAEPTDTEPAATETDDSAAPEPIPTTPSEEGEAADLDQEPRDEGDLLPAALYFLNQENDQIYRLDADGSELTQLTFEPAPVVEFAVSGEAGLIAYVSNNTLYTVELTGADRREIAQGGPDESDFSQTISGLDWSPDGTTLVYGNQGIVFYDPGTELSEMQLPNDPPPDLTNPEYTPEPEPAQFYTPISFSPNGTQLLIQAAIYFSDGIGYQILNIITGERTQLSSPAGIVCCNPRWAPDGDAIYISNDSVGFLEPGMWQIRAANGDGTTIIEGVQEGGEAFQLVNGARMLADGLVYHFYGTIESMPDTPTPLSMARSDPQGEDLELLREDNYIPGAVLWDPAASGAVIMDLTAQYAGGEFPPFPFRGPLLWIPVDGSAPVDLGVTGAAPQWGP
ncbi:MAG: hypothetical protein ACFB51_03905 [Anaerolineae bacterium]